MFRPKFVTGAMEAGFTYGFRTSDQVLLRQPTGSNQWVEVQDAQELADVLAALTEEAGELPAAKPHWLS